MELKVLGNSKVYGVKDVPATSFISVYSKHLKESGQFEMPKWMEVAKSSCAKELPPVDPDFLYIRAASIIRKFGFCHTVGVGKLRQKYGSKQNNGVAPSHHRDASGKIIRYCIQQLEKMGLLEGEKLGPRKLTSKGRASIDQIARQCV